MKEPVARLVIKDLIKGDGIGLELKETQELLFLEQKKIVIKDSIIGNLQSKIVNLEVIIGKKDQQFSLEREKSESLLKELKSEKRKTFLFKVGTYVGIIATGILVLPSTVIDNVSPNTPVTPTPLIVIVVAVLK